MYLKKPNENTYLIINKDLSIGTEGQRNRRCVLLILISSVYLCIRNLKLSWINSDFNSNNTKYAFFFLN